MHFFLPTLVKCDGRYILFIGSETPKLWTFCVCKIKGLVILKKVVTEYDIYMYVAINFVVVQITSRKKSTTFLELSH